jgi:hypothetical protein
VKTVSDVMMDVFSGQGFKCLLHEKRSLDSDPYSEYAESDLRIKGKLFELPKNDKIRKVNVPGITETTATPLTYFMDGSRRVFRFSDIILNDGRYYPVLAGQVGVAVLGRSDDGAMYPLNDYVTYKNLLVFPDTIDEADREVMRKALSAHLTIEFIVEDYETRSSGGNGSEDYINKATKKILDKMHDLELHAVRRMMDDRVLRNDAMLVIDGSLQFRREVLTRNNFPAHQLRNVIGISKSFTPSQPVTGMSGGKHLGSILQDVEFGHRTPVFKAGEDAFVDILGVWYLRIRRRSQLRISHQKLRRLLCRVPRFST